MANGILIVDKPTDWTSQDVVSKLRGVFHERRVGHGGTLDPMATGVLPVFFGRATRGVEFFEHAEKAYIAELRLGQVTDTQDTTGNTLELSEVSVSRKSLEEALQKFLGEIEQLPPMYSAIKIGGKKLYELARQGKEVERKVRKISIFGIKLLDFDGQTARIYVHCSKGTYVRTLCHDIGQALGCGGCMAALQRVQAGKFVLAQAHTMEEILACENPAELLLPTDSLFEGLPKFFMDGEQEKRCRNGAEFFSKIPDGKVRVYSENGGFFALCEVNQGCVKTVKSFFEP